MEITYADSLKDFGGKPTHTAVRKWMFLRERGHYAYAVNEDKIVFLSDFNDKVGSIDNWGKVEWRNHVKDLPNS